MLAVIAAGAFAWVSAAAATPLQNGQTVGGGIASAGAEARYTFSAGAGNGIVLTAQPTSGTLSARLSLLAPDGTTLVSSPLGSYSPRLLSQASVTGSYTAVVSDDKGTGTGNFGLSLVVAPGAQEGGALAVDVPVQGTLEASDLDSYTFTAQAGEYLHLRMSNTGTIDFRPNLIVFGPDGRLLADVSETVPGSGVNAPANVYLQVQSSGVHTVVASGTSFNVSYSLTLRRLQAATPLGAIASGGQASGTLAPGAVHAYTFSASAGQDILLRAADDARTGFTPMLTLYGPGGTAVVTASGPNVAGIQTRLPATGTYTVTVSDAAATPVGGAYTLHRAGPGANKGGVLPVDSRTDASITLGELDSYTIQAEAGQYIHFNLVNTGSADFLPWIDLVGPQGTVVTSAQANPVAGLGYRALSTGTYSVIVYDASSSPNPDGSGTRYEKTGPYRLNYTRAPGGGEGGALAADARIARVIPAGDLQSFTINAQAGETVQLRMAVNGSQRPVLSIFGPDGVGLPSAGIGLQVHAFNFVAPLSGTYTVIVKALPGYQQPLADVAYTLHTAKVPGAQKGGQLVEGAVRTDTLEKGGLASYVFPVNAGDRVQLQLANTTGGAFRPDMYLYGPTGTFLGRFPGTATSSSIDKVLQASGTYTLVIADASAQLDQAGSYSLRYGRLVTDPNGGDVPLPLWALGMLAALLGTGLTARTRAGR